MHKTWWLIYIQRKCFSIVLCRIQGICEEIPRDPRMTSQSKDFTVTLSNVVLKTTRNYFNCAIHWFCTVAREVCFRRHIYRSADMSWARPTARCILFDGENISFDASLVMYVNSTNFPPIIIIKMTRGTNLMQQLWFIIINNSTCFGNLYVHLQECRLCVAACVVQH